MWSKAILCRFRQPMEILQTQASQGFAAFRLTPSRIQPRHSQMCVGTFKRHSAALFGPFCSPAPSSLVLFCPACFKKKSRLLGFVWDGILYIKSASDRVYIQQRVLLPQRAAQKLRRINNEISAMTKRQQADLDDSQPAERRCLFYVLPFSSNACSFTRECNADFYN